MRRECRERFPRHRLQRKPLISDPGMHHGTCVKHVSWCMSWSLTRGGGVNVPGIPGACATGNFTYLARGPLQRTKTNQKEPERILNTSLCMCQDGCDSPWCHDSFEHFKTFIAHPTISVTRNDTSPDFLPNQGWGVLKVRSLISPLREILILQKYKLDTFNHVHICQVSPQLSCADTCQIWTGYHSGNHCFHHSEKNRKIKERRKLA